MTVTVSGAVTGAEPSVTIETSQPRLAAFSLIDKTASVVPAHTADNDEIT